MEIATFARTTVHSNELSDSGASVRWLYDIDKQDGERRRRQIGTGALSILHEIVDNAPSNAA